MKIEKQRILLLALKNGWLMAKPSIGHCFRTGRFRNGEFHHGELQVLGTLARNSYQKASFRFNGTTCTFQTHQLIWLAVHGEIPQGMQIHHINHRADDNRIQNLQLVNVPEHALYHPRNGMRTAKTRAIGSEVKSAKLTETDIPKIRELSQAGMSLRAVAARFGVSYQTIYLIMKGETWRHVAAE